MQRRERAAPLDLMREAAPWRVGGLNLDGLREAAGASEGRARAGVAGWRRGGRGRGSAGLAGRRQGRRAQVDVPFCQTEGQVPIGRNECDRTVTNRMLGLPHSIQALFSIRDKKSNTRSALPMLL
jgi:hypothetical protein